MYDYEWQTTRRTKRDRMVNHSHRFFMEDASLPLHDLSARHYGLTQFIAGGYEEAARVCLDRHHSSPVHVSIRAKAVESNAVAIWEKADDRTRGALNNQTDTTMMGAYGCVIAAVELTQGAYTVRRAETATGADYYVAPPGMGIEDLEGCFRLEVSGISKGNGRAVDRLLFSKMEQTRRGNSNLPAIAGVIGFEVLRILIEYVDAP
jgi:hypothetical protein